MLTLDKSRSVEPSIPLESKLALCAQEAIQFPAAIQPHGAVLAARMSDLIVTHASANLGEILGVPAEAALGQHLCMVVGEDACLPLQAVARGGVGLGQSDYLTMPNGDVLHLQATRAGPLCCIAIEKTAEFRRGLLGVMAQVVLETFTGAQTRLELCELAVRGLKTLTGYDRVLAYCFDEAGHGEVIAEAREDRLEPYLGLHYPASDIPGQARRLYLRQRVGSIADSRALPVPMHAHPTLHDGTPLDLTHCSLRAISPIHLEYMRNMGTAASLTIGLAHEHELWGMLVCHHGTPRVAGAELRAAADIIGQVVTLMLVSLGQSEAYVERLDRSGTLRSLTQQLEKPVALFDALAAAGSDLLKLVKADGAILRISGITRRVGETPPEAAALRALSVLSVAAAGEVMAADQLGLQFPELADCTRDGSGALLLPLAPAGDDAILWFRPELSRHVIWGGNPSKPAIANPETGSLSPRTSFAAWKDVIRGHCAPWREADLALVRELQVVIQAQVAQRTRAELAKLRNYDPLTGLPNRRLLQSLLADDALSSKQGAPGVLFLDLDRFKAVNDTLGHGAGDALLIQVARRLVAAVGPEHIVARLGGDEFVILCRGPDGEAIASLGERIRLAIEEPFEITGRPCHISVSLGIARADELDGVDLLQAADLAMYAAKKCGGNRGKVFDRSLYEHVAKQFELEHDLRNAIGEGGQFELVYQPILNLAPRRTVAGFEARLRWHHPRQGWITPNLIIPMAEKSGLILPLGAWILAEAVRQGRQFQELRPGEPLWLSVNISPAQLTQQGFCAQLSDLLAREQFPASLLCAEVREMALEDPAAAFSLAELRRLGIHVALDDFGMGYTSLSRLRGLPVDIVKLDRSFLDPGAEDVHRDSFIGAVINLAHAAGLSVVAKGIETPAELAMVAEAGVDTVQGFLLGPALSANDAMDLLLPAAVA